MAWKWTASEWRKASKHGKWWRSSEFNAIETAIGSYSPAAATRVRLEKLQAILVAIAKWWSWKQEDKHGHKDKPIDAPPPGAPARKYAASEETLKGTLNGNDFSARVESVRGLVKDVAAEIDDVLALDRAAWGTDVFTDPSKPVEDFVYLVSAQTETPISGEPEYRLNTIKKPELISNAVISASVIRKGNVKLWGPAGFILSAPKTCIAAAANQDLAAANAVGMKHEVEKYIELLRLYLRSDKLVDGATLPAPGKLVPTAMRHTEVVVLGKNYDKVTTVTGVYVLVDANAPDKPGSCYRKISQFTVDGALKYVVEPLPLVTEARMKLYTELKTLPIVPIPIDHTTTELNVKYFDNVYGEGIMFPFKPTQMIKHGSDEHKALELRAKNDSKITRLISYTKHGVCAVCGTT
jgi:hypothetical protein